MQVLSLKLNLGLFRGYETMEKLKVFENWKINLCFFTWIVKLQGVLEYENGICGCVRETSHHEWAWIELGLKEKEKRKRHALFEFLQIARVVKFFLIFLL